LTSAVHVANEIVFAASEKRLDRKGMGTTLVAVLVGDKSFAVAHVGDSRLYAFQRGALRQITRDHSLVAEQVAKGLLTEAQAETSDIKNVLTRALGISPTVEVDADEYPLKPGDALLLCSDGLCRMADDGEISAALSALDDPSEMCHNLVRLALDKGGKDNVTVVIGKMERSGFFERLAGRLPVRRNGKGA
jgi:protein phosphatase